MLNARQGVCLNHSDQWRHVKDPVKRTRNFIVVGLLLVFLGSSALLSGCVDDEKSFVIMAVIPPDTPPDCAIGIQGGTNFDYLSHGLLALDFLSHPTYAAFLQVHNYLLNNSDEDSGRLDSNRVVLERFEISYSWEVGDAIIQQPGNENLAYLADSPPLVIPIGGFVGSADDVDKPGKALIGLYLIPPDQGQVLQDIPAGDELSVVLGVHVKAFGHTVGGKAVESNSFLFPIYFCRNCHGCPTDYDYLACFPGQDSFSCEEQNQGN